MSLERYKQQWASQRNAEEAQQPMFGDSSFAEDTVNTEAAMQMMNQQVAEHNQELQANAFDQQMAEYKMSQDMMTQEPGPMPMVDSREYQGSAFRGMPTTPGSGANIKTSGMFNEFTGLRGNKAFRNNNPGNITGMGGKLLYGAKGFAGSKHGDAGDRNQLVYGSAEDGTRAMHSLMSGSKYNNAPIAQAFSKWQTDQKAWNRMKNEYRHAGIDVDRSRYNDLSSGQKQKFMQIRANHEGYGKSLPNIF